MVVQRPRFRWSVDDYEKLFRHGILTEYHEVELIRGEIVPKMPKGDLHAWCLKALIRLFAKLPSSQTTLSVQDPIYLADSAPEPDFALLVPRDDLYRTRKPRGDDAIHVVEVADSSLDFDREVKGPLYAENGIAEYWIVNVNDHCLEVCRDPRPDGTYADHQILKPGESISLALLPDVSVAVAEIVP